MTWHFWHEHLHLHSFQFLGSGLCSRRLQLSSVLEPQFLKPSPPRLHVLLERFSASFLAVSSPCGSDIPPNLPFIGPICLIRLCVIAGTGLNVRFGGQPVSLPLPINTLDKMLGSSEGWHDFPSGFKAVYERFSDSAAFFLGWNFLVFHKIYQVINYDIIAPSCINEFFCHHVEPYLSWRTCTCSGHRKTPSMHKVQCN